MKELSAQARIYIISIILIGIALIVWTLFTLDWANTGLFLLAALGAVTQTLKVEGPNDKTNYNIAWFVYGFTFFLFGPASALFVVLIAHLGEWLWHKYPWYIQSFNIGAHSIPVFLAGLVFETVSGDAKVLDLNGAMGMVVSNLFFILVNHFQTFSLI